MNEIAGLPELRALEHSGHLIRLTDQMDVPVTDRVMRLVDSRPFRRLAEIRQLGLVALVYPGATHTRFEHSLGVYRNALLFIKRLLSDARFGKIMSIEWVEGLLVASLLHDVGHWPFCHPIEDLGIEGVPAHESLAAPVIEQGEIGDLLRADWVTSPDQVISILRCDGEAPACRLAATILSGPLDVDKIDYLYRDSVHCGVPYGRHFDAGRLIGSLCLNAAGDGIAMTTKGRTAAELLVFARYVMFSEVYWHHAVRSATAMLQRAFWERFPDGEWSRAWGLVDHEWVEAMRTACRGWSGSRLVEGLFGRRSLYKRWFELSSFDRPDVYRRVAHRPYPWTVGLASELAARLTRATGTQIAPTDVLVDAPPSGLEVQFAVDVYDPRRDEYQPLRAVSPVVAALAERQFDAMVKQVRVFVAPGAATAVRRVEPLPLLAPSLDALDQS